MEKITVKEYIEGKANGKKVFTVNAFGRQEVTGIRWPETNPWIVCGKENAGFGISYCVNYSDTLEVEAL
jgi:hypothetical protein